MKLLKPIWVKHDDKLPIFSVDIHPDGTRFATGGQGADSGRVVIWNMAPILSEAAESDENIPKMLCQLDNHLACVNCVRWSFMGQHLASGSDDKLIMIWKQVKCSAGGSTVFGSGGGKVNVETWRCTATLRAHTGDVLDLAWSANDAWLASCSVDNTVVVWNALRFPEQAAVLNNHTGLVKGVAWDPVGKYLSSQSEDKTLRIWRTGDWKEVHVVKKPFEKCSGTTHVLRLCWSPDGQYLVSAHAKNGPGPTAQIVERAGSAKGWLTNRDFVGHRKPVTCARFSQVLLRQKGMKHAQYSCCCALGSRDQSVSVWLTNLKRPLVVVSQLFTKSVSDVAWSLDGTHLIACSQDGTVACIQFTREELGEPFTHEEMVAILEKKYGKSLLSSTSANCANWSRVSETPEMLLWQEENKEKERNEGAKKILGEDKAVVASPIKGPINKQIEVRTADGRRRITPMFIPPTPDTADATSQSNMSSGSQPTFFSSESKSRIIVERREDIVEPNVARVPSKSVVVNGHGPSKTNTSGPTTNDTAAAPTKDNQEKAVVNAERTPFAPVTFGGKRRAEKEISGPGRPSNSSANQSAPNSNQMAPKRPRLNNIVSERPQVASLQDAGPLATKSDVPTFVLPALRISKSATEQVNTANKRQRKWIDVENNVLSSAQGSLSRVRLMSASATGGSNAGMSEHGKANSVEWESVFGSPVSGVATNSRLVVVTCDDATLHTLDLDKGQYQWPALVLRSPASRLALNAKSQLMVVTACAHLTIWDLVKRKAILRNESMLPIIYGDSGISVAVLSCSLSEDGTPMVSLSSGKAYIFDLEFGCWMVMGNSRDPVNCNSIPQSLLGVPLANTTSLPLACLQSDIRSCGPAGYSRTSMGSAGGGIGPACSLAFLDRQLAACRALRSPTEYRHWLLATVRFLMHHDLEKRLRDLCDSLLGPAYKGAAESQSWDKIILGLSKHSLLKEVLRLLATNVRWQRIYVEYSEQLRTEDESVIEF